MGVNMNNQGKIVRVNYRGYFDDGEVFDSTDERGPFEFTCGREEVLLGFDRCVALMSPGEKKTIHIGEMEAYGPRTDDNIQIIPKYFIPNAEALQLGMTIYYTSEEGYMPCKVIEITDETIKLDGNHPLAGRNLGFDIELLEVREPEKEEKKEEE